MGASGEQAQHPSGIGRIARFAENSAIHYDDSIRPQNEIIRTDAEHSLRFFTCHAFGEISGKLAFLRDLRNIRWLNDEGNSCIAQQLLAPRRRGSEHQHALTAPYDSPDRFDQLSRVITDSVFEDDLDIFNVFNFVGRVTFNDDEVGLLARGNGADALSFAEILRAVGRGNVDSFERSESSLD